MNPEKIRIFISRQIPDNGINLLEKEKYEVRVWKNYEYISQAELMQESKNCDALLCMLSDKIDKHFLQSCNHLKVISLYSAGYNNIDLEEATRIGIPVGNTPGAMSEATADVAFGLMIATARKMFHMHKTIGRGQWGNFLPSANLGMELKGKTLGIFGLGRIGYAMAERCRAAFKMNIIYHNRNRNPDAEKELQARRVSFEDLLAQSDVISVHCGLTPETEGIFDHLAFRKMKDTVIFINTSRGKVHVESDLINALQMHWIWGAGLDVMDPEPMRPDNPLLEMENTCVLPHIGSATLEARNEMARMAAQNIIGFFREGKIPYLLNPGAIQ